MTLNDPILTEYTREIHKIEEHLDRHVRDNMQSSLFLDFMLLAEIGRKGMERLNAIKKMPALPDGYK